MNYVISTYVEEFDNDNNKHYQHFHKNILITNEEEEHLPMTVYLSLPPMMSLQFLNHIMLLFVRYATDLDISLHGSIREQFQKQNSFE